MYHSKILHSADIVLVCALYESQNRQQVLPFTELITGLFITEMQSVYCVVRTESLNKTVYSSSLKG
jgi:hypothetical protein